MPKTIPILLTTEMFSLKNIIPINTTITKFRIVKIEIVFDNVSYFNEKAQNKVPMEYIKKPAHIKSGLFSTVHFLKKISPTISKPAPKNTKTQNNIFADIIFDNNGNSKYTPKKARVKSNIAYSPILNCLRNSIDIA